MAFHLFFLQVANFSVLYPVFCPHPLFLLIKSLIALSEIKVIRQITVAIIAPS